MQLIKYNQFDTIYHEHFSYLSLISVKSILEKHGLKIFNVEELSTHGGSLRVYACHNSSERIVEESVENILNSEINFGLNNIYKYKEIQKKSGKNQIKINKFFKLSKNARKESSLLWSCCEGKYNT